MAGTTRIPPLNCLMCGVGIDAVGDLGSGSTPREGDPVACIYCGAVSAWDAEKKTLRPFSVCVMTQRIRPTTMRTTTTWMRNIGNMRGPSLLRRMMRLGMGGDGGSDR